MSFGQLLLSQYNKVQILRNVRERTSTHATIGDHITDTAAIQAATTVEIIIHHEKGDFEFCKISLQLTYIWYGVWKEYWWGSYYDYVEGYQKPAKIGPFKSRS